MTSRCSLIAIVAVCSLLDSGIAAAQGSGATLLFQAARDGDAKAVRRLVAQGIAVDTADAEGRTALMVAAGVGNAELVRLLLYMGASRSATSARDMTAADIARRANFSELAALLEPAGGYRTTPTAPVAAATTVTTAMPPARPVSGPVAARPASAKAEEAGARKLAEALKKAALTMATLDEANGDGVYREDLAKVKRGDKDAAQRIAAMHRLGSNGLAANAHRAEQWLRVAAELGSAEASWQVSQIYNRDGLVADAASFEARAAAAGYRLPPRLPTRSMNF